MQTKLIELENIDFNKASTAKYKIHKRKKYYTYFKVENQEYEILIQDSINCVSIPKVKERTGKEVVKGFLNEKKWNLGKRKFEENITVYLALKN